MKGIEAVIRETKPSAVSIPQPVMREHEDQKPQQQDPVVDDRVPEETIAGEFDAHTVPSSFGMTYPAPMTALTSRIHTLFYGGKKREQVIF